MKRQTEEENRVDMRTFLGAVGGSAQGSHVAAAFNDNDEVEEGGRKVKRGSSLEDIQWGIRYGKRVIVRRNFESAFRDVFALSIWDFSDEEGGVDWDLVEAVTHINTPARRELMQSIQKEIDLINTSA